MGAHSTVIDQDTRTRVIEGMLGVLRDYYVFPEFAARIEEEVRRRLAAGEYETIATGPALRDALTARLQAVSGDRHLRLAFSPEPLPPRTTSYDDPAWYAEYRQEAALANYGFAKVERLAGNVGFLDLREFADAEIAAETGIAAMNFLAHTDALIVDLRHNDGGDSGMVALLTTYLFPADYNRRVHLIDLYSRADDTIEQYRIWPYLTGRRYVDKPVYVLTSGDTFSAGEEYAYGLKHLGRATIVGERTRGGAHPKKIRQITPHFELHVPVARAINPISGGNWEGVGVEPDIVTPAEDALALAYRGALGQVLERLGDAPLGPFAALAEEARAALAELVDDMGVAS